MPRWQFCRAREARSVGAEKLRAAVLKVAVIGGYVLIINGEYRTAAVYDFFGGLIFVRNRVREVDMHENGHFFGLHVRYYGIENERRAAFLIACRELIFREGGFGGAELCVLAQYLNRERVGLLRYKTVLLLLKKLLYFRFYGFEFICRGDFFAKRRENVGNVKPRKLFAYFHTYLRMIIF